MKFGRSCLSWILAAFCVAWPGMASARDAGAPAEKYDWSKIDKMVADARTPNDFAKVVLECIPAGTRLIKADKTPMSDPEYWSHCKAEPARAQARIAIKKSTPKKMHELCISAYSHTSYVAKAGKPDAAEFKKLNQDVKKACGLS